jgi:hypothetical protein
MMDTTELKKLAEAAENNSLSRQDEINSLRERLARLELKAVKP